MSGTLLILSWLHIILVTSDASRVSWESRLGYPCSFLTPDADDYDRAAGYILLSGTAGTLGSV